MALLKQEQERLDEALDVVMCQREIVGYKASSSDPLCDIEVELAKAEANLVHSSPPLSQHELKKVKAKVKVLKTEIEEMKRRHEARKVPYGSIYAHCWNEIGSLGLGLEVREFGELQDMYVNKIDTFAIETLADVTGWSLVMINGRKRVQMETVEQVIEGFTSRPLNLVFCQNIEQWDEVNDSKRALGMMEQEKRRVESSAARPSYSPATTTSIKVMPPNLILE